MSKKLSHSIPIRKLSDEQLNKKSREMVLSLNLLEMKTIQEYYTKLKRDPTDIELETLAQTWSEHCKHKIFNSRIEVISKGKKKLYLNLFKQTIRKATETVRKQKGKKDFCLSVFVDNAGIIRLDKNNGIAFKVETHNHPSALDPYGGANTGIGGVVRDILGCGLGAKPVFNTDVFCFAFPDFPYSRLPRGIMHPKRVYKGVVAGVRDYGNRMGIPTINGSINFHNNYLGNPLVFCGTAGIIPVNKIAKKTLPGYDIISAGGRTGRDGIHGATFSSAELTENSEKDSSQAVQIGNPIEEKKVQDILLQARDRDLYINVTDCGAGGFASAVGEIAEQTGADVFLDKALLKYKGLMPWEIFLSESQERMVFIVHPSKTPEFLKLCRSEDVEAQVIGKTVRSRVLTLFYKKEIVGKLDMKFLHSGVPLHQRRVILTEPDRTNILLKKEPEYGKLLKKILKDPNIASKECVIRQYDHEVQGGTILKPLQGVLADGPGDASASDPALKGNGKAVFTSNGININYGVKDPYRMALAVIDEAMRNIVAAGGDPNYTAILDNFCWGNPNKDEQLASLVQAAQGCHDAAVAYGVPFISGKDSFYNEFSMKGRTISVPPTLLISAISIGEKKNITSTGLHYSDSLIMIIGRTNNEMGGSRFNLIQKKNDGTVPDTDLVNGRATFKALHSCIRKGLVLAAHDLSEGGLAVGISEMAFSGGIGVEIDLSKVPAGKGITRDYELLFSESNSRFLLEVNPNDLKSIKVELKGLPYAVIGKANTGKNLKIKSRKGRNILNESIRSLKNAWKTDKVYRTGGKS